LWILDDMKPTKLHQDIAKVIDAELGNNNNQNMVKLIYKKTQEVIAKLQTIKEQFNNELTLDKLKELKQHPDLERFLYNIALSENMVSV